ncbi:hypothetical protein SLNWT_1558 [Streptomyces albus]|uniref:Uncharacterized protein n=1 Tax=Streptomyces albus (strain ATCC 21838 / DSM 41398 / FERM P-419 / JCM 4703 / NBRC 107858) TaxID=1081613 RepID=A0A0B5EK64_STRA4|nr:hypothetical protein SLNWT_1558 [Streptomyces albus]AOU76251.1 hypothetical protein SLNHY_1560 [Streptomyces albus]AYN32038.1 hypothetical protein DUI70_1535 [Streptomyces albus]
MRALRAHGTLRGRRRVRSRPAARVHRVRPVSGAQCLPPARRPPPRPGLAAFTGLVQWA